MGIGNSVLDDFGQRSPTPYRGLVEALTPGGAGKIGPLSLGMINAWHGGPHRFRQFKWDKIGTGEKHRDAWTGHFAAEEPKVGRQYSHITARPKIVGKEGETVLSLNKPEDLTMSENIAASFLVHPDDVSKMFTFDQATAKIRTVLQNQSMKMPPELRKEYQNALDVLSDWKKRGYGVSTDKHLYKLELKWPDKGKTAGKEAVDPMERKHFLSLDDLSQGQPAPFDPSRSGKDIYKEILDKVGGDKTKVPEYLKELDIPGLRYLDAFSRPQSGKVITNPTYNYVIYRDDIPNIVGHELVPYKK